MNADNLWGLLPLTILVVAFVMLARLSPMALSAIAASRALRLKRLEVLDAFNAATAAALRQDWPEYERIVALHARLVSEWEDMAAEYERACNGTEVA